MIGFVVYIDLNLCFCWNPSWDSVLFFHPLFPPLAKKGRGRNSSKVEFDTPPSYFFGLSDPLRNVFKIRLHILPGIRRDLKFRQVADLKGVEFVVSSESIVVTVVKESWGGSGIDNEFNLPCSAFGGILTSFFEEMSTLLFGGSLVFFLREIGRYWHQISRMAYC